ncbi:MAG: Na(+)/H(+) antiporter subunit D [Myxococcales bacterium]|nr:Na(+)/H(+) antiporter subunit D [Myxococcales bacterium]HIK84341.1 Na(+)/H(+) antiporter subunit D [Myxococcales bacterium]
MIDVFVSGLPPGVLLIVAAIPAVLLPHRLSQAVMMALPIVGLAHLLQMPADFSYSIEVFDYTLQITRIDGLSRVFGIVFHIAAFLGVLYASHQKDRLQAAAALIYAGAAIAAVFAGDLMTLFVWWELTAVSSVFLVWASRTEAALKAGQRYLIIQVMSGLLLLAGAILLYRDSGTLAFEHIGLESAGGWLVFLSFGIKAAFPLLHGWMKDAYPEATVTGTVFLSGFTTKLAIYALARGYAGTDILIPIGVTMTAFPIFFAVIENDLRRVLSYSLNNQLGFMVVGVGVGTELALNGTVAHVFAHVIYKALLFMAMGAVLFRTGTIKASELGGLYKSMPWTAFFCIIGSLSISGFPLTSGFVSKSMVLSAVGHEHLLIISMVLLFASAGVLDHSGIKIPFFSFFAHDSGIRVKEAPINMRLAMGIAAAFCIGIGVFPEYLYAILPYPVEYSPYTVSHVVTVLQLLLFAALAFVVLWKTGLYPPELRSVILDIDWTWRRLLPAAWSGVSEVWLMGQRWFLGTADRSRLAVLDFTRAHLSPWTRFGEPWPTGVTAMWAAVLLFAYLLLSF